MILLWDQLKLYYGDETYRHRHGFDHDDETDFDHDDETDFDRRFRNKFKSGGYSTYALLCCRFSPIDNRLSNIRGRHAERRLLDSDNWKVHVRSALKNWDPRSSTIVVTMAVNRSPCQDCAVRLVGALEELNRVFPVACENSRFILACRGLYSGRDYILGTRKNAFARLKEAGWEQCVLLLDPKKGLPSVGRELLREIEVVEGRGFVRLR